MGTKEHGICKFNPVACRCEKCAKRRNALRLRVRKLKQALRNNLRKAEVKS